MRLYLECMSSNSQSVNPVQDLLNRVTELQRILEDIEPNIRNNRVRTQYENVRTKLADAKSSIWALDTVIDRYRA
jgi:archaellum component FlaC